MILEKLSIHLLEQVFEYFSTSEMKLALLINRFFADFILKQLKRRINITMIADVNPKRILQKFSQLTKLVLIIPTYTQELKDIIVVIPNTVKLLKMQLNHDLLMNKKFYTYINRYHSQLTSLKLQATGPSIGLRRQDQIINVKFLHNIFYKKMKVLETFKVMTVGLSEQTQYPVQNYLFPALFYHDDICSNQPTIKKIQFDQIDIPVMNFQKNTTITSVTIKQFAKNEQLNLTQNLGLFTNLFGPQVTQMKLTQHVNEHTQMQADTIRLFLNHFVNLRTFQFNMYLVDQFSYNISYEIINFQLDDIAKLTLKSLGLASLKAHQSHFASLLSQLPLLETINLDFTHIDDQCLLLINQLKSLKEIRLRGCRRLTNESLIPFLQNQKSLKYIDIRGVIGFSKKAFRLLIKHNLLDKISFSNNKINNEVLLDLLDKNKLSFKSLNIGELMQNPCLTNDVFAQANQRQIQLVNLTTLQILFTSHNGFSIKVLPNLLGIVPFLQIISLKVEVQHIIFIFEQLQKSYTICKSLQKLTFTCNGGAYFNLQRGENDIVQSFRDKMKRIDTITLNFYSEIEYLILTQVLQKTRGRELRLVCLQMNSQFIV